MNVVHIPRSDLDRAWPVIEPLAAKMSERFPDDWPLHEVWRRAAAGFLHLLLVWDDAEQSAKALIGAEVQRTASDRLVLAVMLAAGENSPEWGDAVEDMLTRYARENDCEELRIDGRAGWARLAGDGWTVKRLIAATKKVA